MFLNKKSLYILSLFFSLNKFSYSDLEKILNIKRRSIENNIKTINDFLESYSIDGIEKKDNLFFLKSCCIDKIKEILKFAPLSVAERKEYLLLQLFFENTINLNNNTDKIRTTRRTLNYDLIDIKQYLNYKNLTIESISGKGIFLDGDEVLIRNLFSIHLSKYLINQSMNHQLFSELIDQYFNKQKVDEIKKFLLNLCNSISINLVPEDFYRIVSRILINWSREDKIIFEKDYFTPIKIKNHKFYDKTLCFLKMSGLEHLKLYELDSILETLFSLDPKNYENPDKDTSIFMNEIKKNFGLDISNNLQTVMRISNTLRVGKLKCEYDFYENKEIYNLTDIQKIELKKIAKIVDNDFYKFYFEDILYLSTILKNHSSNSVVNENKYKRIVIVDDTFDQIYGSLLVEHLK
ncbi:MAG: hypothetical protein ACRCZR_00245, partial [Cetobacterium sp.]